MDRPRETRGFLTPQRLATLALLVAGGLFLAFFPPARHFVGSAFSYLAQFPPDILGLRDFLLAQGGHLWIWTSLLMVLQSLAAPIPAVPITMVNALIYGPWLGALISWGSAELAAALCFLIARALGRPFVERLFTVKAVAKVDRFFARHGLGAVLVLRLVPFVSFDVVSYAGGLTTIRLFPFLIATGLGQLPATIVYSEAGARLATDVSGAAKLALSFLALMGIAVACLAWRMQKSSAHAAKPASSSDDRG